MKYVIRNTLSRTIIISLFAIAMGFLESAVVVYLRAIYYPEGFAFPLKIIEGPIAVTEIIREAATMIMLLTVCMLAAKRWIIRFAWFIYMFAIWDIFYYVFLWLILGWPESLLSWDILFLIPTTWAGPVIAPVINSFTMILLAGVIIQADNRTNEKQMANSEIRTANSEQRIANGEKQTGGPVRLTVFEWGILLAGSLITILAYILDYSTYMLKRFSFVEWFSLSNKQVVLEQAAAYVPISFNWILFSSGTTLFFIAIGLFIRRFLNSTGKDLPH